jgi:hypothetical protein
MPGLDPGSHPSEEPAKAIAGSSPAMTTAKRGKRPYPIIQE